MSLGIANSTVSVETSNTNNETTPHHCYDLQYHHHHHHHHHHHTTTSTTTTTTNYNNNNHRHTLFSYQFLGSFAAFRLPEQVSNVEHSFIISGHRIPSHLAQKGAPAGLLRLFAEVGGPN